MIRGMKMWLAALAAAIAGLIQPAPPAVEQGTLRLHYVQKPIGYERYQVARAGDSYQLTSDVDFTDRGGRVQMAATLRTKADYTPIHFTARGKSYRFVNVDTDVTVDGDRATIRSAGAESHAAVPAQFFTVDGYAPFAAQMLMLRYWMRHGRPRTLMTIPGIPANDVIIEARGPDTVHVGDRSIKFDRVVVDGVVWGRESLWLDANGSIAAAITRAGGLSFEAVREDLEPALVEFVRHGTDDRLADLQALTTANPPIRSGTFALAGGRIIDGTGRDAIADGVVIVRDGAIADVGPRSAITIPAGVPTVDVTGRTLIPGLWDMHTHVTQIEWAPVYLAAGVTTVRDMGNEFEFITALRDQIARGNAIGPRLLLAGLVDLGGPDAFGVYYAATPDEAKRIVGKYHDAGFQQMKIYSLMTPSLVEAVSAEAHRLGMTVTGHVPNGMTIDQAVAAGMDHVAHLAIRGEAGSEQVSKTIAFLRDHHTVIDPTQSWNELLGHALGSPIADFQPGVVKIPAPLNRLFSSAGTTGVDPAGARARLDRGLRIVKALFDAGVPVVVGTDEGIPGHSVHREIELYVEAGLTPMQALQAATIVPARAMKLDGELGTIERGKRADITVLRENPLERIQNIRSVEWTIAGGRVHDAARLWKSVRFQP